MDSVFVITSSPPKELSSKEMVVSKPSFVDEVKASVKRKGGHAALGPNYLRAIAEEIGRRYDRNFNAYRNVVPTDHTGRVCDSDEAVAEVVHEMFQARYPVIYQKYYETVLRERSFSTRVIYFTGAPEDAVVFSRLGIPQITLDEVHSHLGQPKPEATKPSPVKQAPTPPAIKVEPAVVDQPDQESSMALDELAASVQELENSAPKAAPLKVEAKPQQKNLQQKKQKIEPVTTTPVEKQA
jgi:hypothetical protein